MQFTNNCVSVATAQLLAYSDFRELWKDTFGADLDDEPLSTDETVSLILRTGWKCKWTIYWPHNGKSAFSHMQQDPRFHLHPLRLVSYISKDQKVAHCVASGPANGSFKSDFMCFQRDPLGIDLTHEVQSADRIFVFHLRCEHYTPQWCSWIDRQTRRMLERRSDPTRKAQQKEILDSISPKCR